MIHQLQIQFSVTNSFRLTNSEPLQFMKMSNLLLGVILGLLAVVHSTPVNTVTQIPTVPEDEFYREAVTDGFLIDHLFLTSLTTESPKRNTTVQASQQPPSESEEGGVIEGSASGETNDESVFLEHGRKYYATTTPTVSHTQSSTSTMLPKDTDDSSSDSSTTQSPQSGFSSTSVPNEAQSSVSPDHIPAVSSTDFLSSDLGSGSGEILHHYSTTSSSTTSSSDTETSSTSSTSISQIFEESEESGSGMSTSSIETRLFHTTEDKQEMIRVAGEQAIIEQRTSNEHGTPGWIIIVGFIVGVAALVMLCVAIATRDKWNGPREASQLETKTNSSNHQRELEMVTFLPKDNPKENGNAAEYTVIPLDELPEKYSSQ